MNRSSFVFLSTSLGRRLANLCLAIVMITSVGAMTLVASASIDDDQESQGWLQWRGPNRDSLIKAQPWPSDLSENHLSTVWRRELGPSYSGPIVTPDKIFTTETKDEKVEVVHAYERQTGKELWTAQWEGALSVPFFAKSNGDWIRSTPAYDGERLFVAGMRDVLVCLDGETGKQLWRVDFVRDTGAPLPAFGCVCSPLIDGDFLYIQAGAGLCKLNKLTGEIVWKSLEDEGGMNGSAFSSPFLATIDGVEQLLVQTRTQLAGVNTDDGKVLWRIDVPAFRGMNILTPTMVGERIFTSSYGGKSFLYEVAKEGDQWTSKIVWENRQQGYMSSPVVINDHIYLHLRNRRFTCLNAETGEATWTTTPFGQYWSMIAQGDKILALDQDGTLRLVQANPEKFTLISERKLCEDSWAHLAISGSQLVIRELNALRLLDWQGESGK